MLLTTAAIYIVAAEMIPKVGHWTLLSRLYIVCLICNLMTFFVSAIVILLTMLSQEAQLKQDFWAPPLFTRAVDWVFWRLHVGVVLQKLPRKDNHAGHDGNAAIMNICGFVAEVGSRITTTICQSATRLDPPHCDAQVRHARLSKGASKPCWKPDTRVVCGVPARGKA